MNNYVSLESHIDYVEDSERRYNDLMSDYECLKEDYDELKKSVNKTNRELGIIILFQLFLIALLIFL